MAGSLPAPAAGRHPPQVTVTFGPERRPDMTQAAKCAKLGVLQLSGIEGT